jgi:hypothetical protein
MNTAQEIGARLDNDGQCWETPSGLTLRDLVDQHTHTTEYNGDSKFCNTVRKYTFEDNSILIETESYWDYGRQECFCSAAFSYHEPSCEVTAQ